MVHDPHQALCRCCGGHSTGNCQDRSLGWATQALPYGSRYSFSATDVRSPQHDHRHIVPAPAEVTIEDASNQLTDRRSQQSRVCRQVPVRAEAVREHHDDRLRRNRIVKLLDPAPLCGRPFHCGTPCCAGRFLAAASTPRCCRDRRTSPYAARRRSTRRATAAPRVGRKAACTSAINASGMCS